jgi:hypothetical protein
MLAPWLIAGGLPGAPDRLDFCQSHPALNRREALPCETQE